MDGVGRARIDEEAEIFTSLRRPLGITSLGLNQIVLRPRQRLRIHRHRHQDEVYLVIRGTLTVELDGGELLTLEPGELVSVASRVRRQISNRGEERCVVVVMGAAGEHDSRDGEAFADWAETEPRPPQEVPLPADL
jgi:mannose-6-phosphate isomerase-like protein (cupin superfamily)